MDCFLINFLAIVSEKNDKLFPLQTTVTVSFDICLEFSFASDRIVYDYRIVFDFTSGYNSIPFRDTLPNFWSFVSNFFTLSVATKRPKSVIADTYNSGFPSLWLSIHLCLIWISVYLGAHFQHSLLSRHEFSKYFDMLQSQPSEIQCKNNILNSFG